MSNQKFFSSFIGSFLFSIICVAQQTPSVKWGNEFNASKRSTLNDIVGHDNTGIYAVKVRYKFDLPQYTLEHYDLNMSPTKTVDLDFEIERFPITIEAILQLHNKLYLFTSKPDNRTKKNTLSVQEIDKKTLLPKPEKRGIASIDFSGERSYNNGSFQIEVSRDSSKLLVISNLMQNKGDHKTFGLCVVDDKFQPLWNKDVTLPYEDNLLDLESFRVDDHGDVYLLGLIFNERRKSKRHGEPNYKYQVFAYRDKGSLLKEYPISLDDKFITDLQIDVNANRDLICAGFYSQQGTLSIKGTYFLTIDANTKDIKTKSIKEFGIDFLTSDLSDRQAEKTKRKGDKGEEAELYSYDLRRMLVGKDGSAILLGEQYIVHEVTYTSSTNGTRTSSTSTYYHYNDIIAVKIDPSGQIKWAEKIVKSQRSVDDEGFFSSYLTAIVNGKLCFIFNDNPKNVGYNGEGKFHAFTRGGESLVVMVTLDQTGKQERKPLLDTFNAEVVTRPKVCEQIKNNEVILFGQRKKTQQFARVTF